MADLTIPLASLVDPAVLDDARLSVVVRFHDPQKIEMLDLALFSLANAGYAEIEVLVCCQDFSADQLAEVRLLIDEMVRPPGSLWRVLNLCGGNGDRRSALANLGIRAATGRYLAFLDFDDVVYAGAHAFLIDRLRAHAEAAVVFGQIVKANITGAGLTHYATGKAVFSDRPALTFYEHNIHPIHSAVIDRLRVPAAELAFDESLQRNEDYDFYLRVTSHGQWRDYRGSVRVGEYHFRSDRSNSVLDGEGDSDVNRAAWRHSERIIEERRRTLRANISVAELATILQSRGSARLPGRTDAPLLKRGEARALERYRRRRQFFQSLIDRLRGKAGR